MMSRVPTVMRLLSVSAQAEKKTIATIFRIKSSVAQNQPATPTASFLVIIPTVVRNCFNQTVAIHAQEDMSLPGFVHLGK